MAKQQKKSNSKKKPANIALKYSGMAFQMAATILVGVLIGGKIDSYMNFEMPYGTMIFALLSTVVAIYVVIKDL